jgi:hypothetical protein
MVKPAADASVNSQSIGFRRHSSLTTVTGVGNFRTLQSVNRRDHRQDARQHAGERLSGVYAVELQAKAEDHAKFVVTGIASAHLLQATGINPLPAGFVVTLKLQSRRSAPTGFTKSNTTAPNYRPPGRCRSTVLQSQ